MRNGKRVLALLLIFCMLAGVESTLGEFAWPDGLTEIGDEAFRGNLALTILNFPERVASIGAYAFADCTQLDTVRFPESIRSIGTGAFSGCSGLNTVQIPDGVAEIGSSAFDGCGEALLIHCSSGSAAYRYALENQVDYRADTTCRALVIGQSYTGTPKALNGPANDMRAVHFGLTAMGWSSTMKSNLSCDEIRLAINNTFSAARDTDISLFYYSGHGETDGSLVGKDGKEKLSPEDLKTALDWIPGRKVVVVDACHSGQLIEDEKQEADEPPLLTGNGSAKQADSAAQFISSFQSVFNRNLLYGVLNDSAYFVITAARKTEKSEEGYLSEDGSGRWMGFFTSSFCQGIGFNEITFTRTNLNADTNGDSAVSIHEAYTWAYHQALARNENQHAAVWPAECRWFAPFRQSDGQ